MDLLINSTYETPEVRFIANKEFSIRGRIVPNANNQFWKKINDWSIEALPTMEISVILDVEIDYINAYSMTQLVNLINAFGILNTRGYHFSVRWYCNPSENEDVYLIGQDLASTSSCPFEFLTTFSHIN